MAKPKPIVALVGRPNVGKSTLFNRLAGARLAVVDERPGTTRDRLHADTEWAGVPFTVVDTGGIEVLPERRLEAVEQRLRGRRVHAPVEPLAENSALFVREIREQAEIAIAEADTIVMLTDAQTGLTAADEEVAAILRRTHKPVIVAVNKADNAALRQAATEFYALGLGEVYPISALHGTGTGDLLDAVVAALPPAPPEEEDEESVKIAIVGRPNVGKSSLLNRLLGEERAIVSPIPGTTRDAIDTRLEWEGVPITLIDTAGIRRRGRIGRGVEKYSVLRALRAIRRADVALLLVDATEGVTAQDTHIAGMILDEAVSVVVLVNKWDAIEKDTYTMVEYSKEVRAALHFMDYVPVLFISALTGQRVNQVIPTALRVQEQRLVRIPTAELNRIVRAAVEAHRPPSKAGKRLKIYYAVQPAVDPPTFIFYVNDPDLVHFSYERYLENRIRDHYEFLGTPLRLVFRGKERGT
ncbi:MAG: ribosome biogenesis GTPase Der [Chloroflexi bacterium]|nr:MAG: ribosome biogenesis GTPase Der [Chloroflexota bacterium]